MINEYLVTSSDWLIAVFKNKLGTPTGKAESGTLEEIELFRTDNPLKPVSVYFFASCNDGKLTQYKDKLTGVWKEYNDCSDLGQEFFINLSQILLTEIANDAKGIVFVSRLMGQGLKIETNGCKYIGYEMALELLCKRRLMEKADPKGEVFRLTELGKQEIVTLKNFLSF